MYESIRLEADPVIAVVSTLLVGAAALAVLAWLLIHRRRAGAA
jgi:ABC-type spermidine/putrescine transport system permease subunit II